MARGRLAGGNARLVGDRRHDKKRAIGDMGKYGLAISRHSLLHLSPSNISSYLDI
jgi:hypothetical protein